MTSRLSPQRIGSGQVNTGWSTQSDLSPGAWLVELPSKPQIGSSAGATLSSRILVFERSLAVGAVPSIQMYSALYAIEGFLSSAVGVWVDASRPDRRSPGCWGHACSGAL